MQDVAVGGSLGGKARVFTLPAKSPAQHQTAADVLDYLCKKYKGTYDRLRRGDGYVVVKFYKADGEVLSGRGDTTMKAVAALQKKLEAGQ